MAMRDNSGQGGPNDKGQNEKGQNDKGPNEKGLNEGKADDKAAGPLGRAQDQAADIGRQGVGAAQNRIRAVFEQQSHRAADQIGSVAQALHQAAEQMEAENNGTAARYTTLAADRVGQFADTLRDSTVDDLVGQVEGYARRQPEIFLGAAFGLGFLFARFIKSSGERVRAADLTRRQSQAGGRGKGGGGGGGNRQRGSYDFSNERQNIGGSYPASARTAGGGGMGGTATGSGTRGAAEMMAGGAPEPAKTAPAKPHEVKP